MGAFSIDVPAGPFLRGNLLQSLAMGLGAFLALGTVSLWIALLSYHRSREREATFSAVQRAKEEAEAASRSKSEFLANMSHELRTPLNAIIGFSDVMADEKFGPLGSGRYVQYSRDVGDSGRHLLNLINDVLDISKVEYGKLELIEEAVDLAEIIDGSLRLVRERADAAEVALAVEMPAPLPPLWATAAASSRSCSTCCRTPSSSPRPAARSACAPSRARTGSSSPSRIAGSAWTRPASSWRCAPSAKSTASSPANTPAPASACR